LHLKLKPERNWFHFTVDAAIKVNLTPIWSYCY